MTLLSATATCAWGEPLGGRAADQFLLGRELAAKRLISSPSKKKKRSSGTKGRSFVPSPAARRFVQVSHHAFEATATYAAAAATLRTVKEIITRERPLIIMLTPTSVPIAHAELAGHFM